jgi:hypothetical protein
MRRKREATIRDLRDAIDCLPAHTRIAMLEGMRGNEIIVGAYSSDAGICPMLAAHRAGGRTNLISFAKAWDGFAFRGSRDRVARRATERELLILRTHLEASLLERDSPGSDLGAAVTAHLQLVGARREALPVETKGAQKPEPRPGDRDRSHELRKRPGWAWLRVFRRLDDYERALARLSAEQVSVEAEHEAARETSPALH